MGKKSKRTKTKQTPEELKKIKLEAEILMGLNSQMGLYPQTIAGRKILTLGQWRWTKQLYSHLDKIMEPSAENGNINSIR